MADAGNPDAIDTDGQFLQWTPALFNIGWAARDPGRPVIAVPRPFFRDRCDPPVADPPVDALKHLSTRIASAEERASRPRGSVGLIAVSKTRSVAEILALAGGGQRRFGENYLQEALPKISLLKGQLLEWHFIGRVQTNKSELIARHFSFVHTVDREKVAAALDAHRPARLPPLEVCIQVDISGEPSKSGVALTGLPALAEAVTRYPRLRLRGLMALPAPGRDFDGQRAGFRSLAAALNDLRGRGHALDTLSIGTSEDFEAAIFEGATLVRVGTALFGPRLLRAR
ncbi:MAG: YggS family pyridoxal phosphate-dependent enzyme [Gammaproteobacteria bacterium]